MAHLLARYCDEIILSYDADEAGQKATKRALDVFSSIGMNVKVLRLTGGKDPDEILRNYGPERFRSLLEGAENDIEFRLLAEKRNFDLSTDDGKLKYLQRATAVLAEQNDSFAADIYSSRLAEELGVEKKTIVARVQSLRTKNYKKRERDSERTIIAESTRRMDREAIRQGARSSELKAQERILAILMKAPELIKHADDLTADDFSPKYRRAFTVLAGRAASGESADLNLLVGELDDEEISFLTALNVKQSFLPATAQELRDCVEKLKSKKAPAVSAKNMSDEEFASLMDAIIKKNDK